MKQEDFDTESGVQGLKGYGTMSMLNPLTKSSEKVYYEILYFKQNQGLQQIMIVFPEVTNMEALLQSACYNQLN